MFAKYLNNFVDAIANNILLHFLFVDTQKHIKIFIQFLYSVTVLNALINLRVYNYFQFFTYKNMSIVNNILSPFF